MTSRELDFDEEAKKLFGRLNLGGASRPGVYNPLDPIWRDPHTGGLIYVGNQVAAQSKKMLDKAGITHVVNCTDNMPQYHEKSSVKPQIKYLRFPISFWMRYEKNLPDFLRRAARYARLSRLVDSHAGPPGENVLVHCLAGAHRAGTTGCLLLMYKASMQQAEAVASAKKLRPVIDPIGG
ncbi:MAG: hypothetical protein SGPRY_011088, partial [Prymnesium sp.]